MMTRNMIYILMIMRDAVVYSNWNIIVGSPNDNSWGTPGVHFRSDAVYTLHEWSSYGNQV